MSSFEVITYIFVSRYFGIILKQISFIVIQRLVPYGEIVNCEISVFMSDVVVISVVSTENDGTSWGLPCTVNSIVVISLQNIIQVQINTSVHSVNSLQQ